MIYDSTTHIPVSHEELQELYLALATTFTEADRDHTLKWLKPIVDRLTAVQELKDAIGDRDHALASDFYFAVRRDPARDDDDRIFELYVCYKIPFLEQDKFPWESPFGLREVLPDDFPESENEDNGLFWIDGDMEEVRQLLVKSGFEEKPEIVPYRNLRIR